MDSQKGRTFVIGDVHGNVDRLIKLIEKAKITQYHPDYAVVQLGDLGHYGRDTHIGDLKCWQLADEYRFDVLWGNHDMANFYPKEHGFYGFDPAYPECVELMRKVRPALAVATHGYLLTHAGLSPTWCKGIEDVLPVSPQEMVDAINMGIITRPRWKLVHAISTLRGGNELHGGILWRDDREDLCDIFPQVYGHSRGSVRKHGKSWCIDVGSKENESLVGLWLPDLTVVAVGPDAEIHETPFPEDE